MHKVMTGLGIFALSMAVAGCSQSDQGANNASESTATSNVEGFGSEDGATGNSSWDASNASGAADNGGAMAGDNSAASTDGGSTIGNAAGAQGGGTVGNSASGR